MAPKKSVKRRSSSQAVRNDSDEEMVDRPAPPSLEAQLLPTTLHRWLNFSRTLNNYNRYCSKLQTLLPKKIEPPRVVDWAPLEVVGLAEPIREILRQRYMHEGQEREFNEWERLFGLRDHIYRELCLEFHATYEFKHNINGINDRDFMKFRLGGRSQYLSLLDFATALGIYSEEESTSVHFGRYLMGGAKPMYSDDFEPEEAWALFSSVPYVPSSVSYLDIDDVNYRVIQRFLAHTIAQRKENTEKVTLSDLWYLFRLRSRVNVNIPYGVAWYLKNLAMGIRGPSPICGGHFITKIARFLNVSLSPESRLTMLETPFNTISSPMFTKARAISLQGGRVIPYRPVSETHQHQRRRAPSHAEHEPHPHLSEQVHTAEMPSFLDVMQGMENLRLNIVDGLSHVNARMDDYFQQLGDFSRRMDGYDYRLGTIEHRADWYFDNQQRYYAQHDPNFQFTPYNPPPVWGTPGATYPPPTYHPDAVFGNSLTQQGEQSHQDPSDDTVWPR